MATLHDTLSDYFAGERHTPRSLALLRPFQVASLLESADLTSAGSGEDALLSLMCELRRRGDEPVFLRRMERFAQTRRAEVFRRYQQAAQPLFHEPR